MIKRIRVFANHQQAREANWDDMRRLSPDERIQVLLELRAWYYQNDPAAQQGLVRVCRLIKRAPR